jgi:hypothetical protein
MQFRARIFKRLLGPGIDSKERIPPAYVAWRAGAITLFLLGPHRLFKNSSSGSGQESRMEEIYLGPHFVVDFTYSMVSILYV